MKALLYVLVGVTCVAVIGFIANQMYRQRAMDRVVAEAHDQIKREVAASEMRLACEPVIERAKQFTTGSAAELNKIKEALEGCDLSLSQIQR